MSPDDLRYKDKKGDSHGDILCKNENNDYSRSTILTAKFGFEATRLIHSIQKNVCIVIGLIAFIATLSVVNIFGITDYISDESEDKVIDTILLVVLIGVLAPLILLLMKSRKVLDGWSDMFERNTIAAAMRIAMRKRGKEDAIQAIAQSVEQIGTPLQDYVNSKRSDFKEFMNIPIDKCLVFDILVDSTRLLDSREAEDDSLRDVLDEYGAIIVKIVDEPIEAKTVKDFVDSLSRYVRLTKNRVGMGMIIGESLTHEAEMYPSKFSTNYRRIGINHLILLEKPNVL